MLFERFSLGKLRLPNRLVRSAVCEGLLDRNGVPTAAMIDLEVKLAKGGCGLVIIGKTAISETGKALPYQCRLDSDQAIQAFKNLTGAVHAAGSRTFLQLGHAGSKSLAPGRPDKPADWTVQDLETIPEQFAAAAKRAQAAGFDGVQVHGAHGYLLSEFLSPCSNARTDAYGGTLQNRARLLLKSVAAIRRATGNDFTISVKLNSADFVENGLTETEAVEVLQKLVSYGMDVAEVSGGCPEAGPAFSPVRRGISEQPYYADFAAKLRGQLSVPVILVGGIRSMAMAEKLLQDKTCDLIALGRPLISEPDLALAWRNGQEKISRCVGCNGCFRPLLDGRGVACRLGNQEK